VVAPFFQASPLFGYAPRFIIVLGETLSLIRFSAAR